MTLSEKKSHPKPRCYRPCLTGTSGGSGHIEQQAYSGDQLGSREWQVRWPSTSCSEAHWRASY